MLHAGQALTRSVDSRQIVREFVRHERAGAVPADEIAFRRQLLEREQGRGPGYGEIVGERPRRWQAGAGLDDTVEHGPTDLRVDLSLQRAPGPAIETDQQVASSMNRHSGPQS